MKALKYLFICVLAFGMSCVYTSCNGDDDMPPPVPTGQSKIFKISNTDLSDISGTATFIENENNSTTINLKLANMTSGEKHPILLRRNVAAEGGGTVIDLGFIDAKKGESSITVDRILSGEKINYEELINFNGYLGIDAPVKNDGGLLAFTDIGPNELTGNTITYGIVPASNTSIAGSAKFSERINGTTLVEIGINENEPNTDFPVDIHTIKEDGADMVIIPLVSLKSEKGGTSQTQIRTTIDGMAIEYSDLLELNARIEVHPNASNLETVIAQGGIGSNANAKIL